MALVGKWTKIEQVQSETETKIVKTSYPAELPEGHPDFDKAGTTEEVEVPVVNITEEVFKNVYVYVDSVNFWKSGSGEDKKTFINVCCRVYNSKEEREENSNSFIDEQHITGVELDYDFNSSQIGFAYDVVKNQIGFEELIND
jgi:hypothetical protein